jgi:hypothetical protein
MKRFISYLKHYFTPKHEELTELALISWRQYIKGKKRIYDMDYCRAYQRGFISQYRHNYAISQLKSAK